MKTVKMVGRSFGEYTNPFYACKDMRWQFVPAESVGPDDLVVFNNHSILDCLEVPVRKRVAWLLESRGIAWYNYHFIEDNFQQFDAVFSCDDSIVALDPSRCFYVPRGGCWIREEDRRIYPKSRFISFISSNKTLEGWTAIGHGFRQDLYRLLSQKGGCLGTRLKRSGVKARIDSFGRITGEALQDKTDSLRDYMFQIAVENMIHDTYFTEKLLDCFATGTVPIFRGTHKVDRFFNPEGIIFFDTLEELTDILTNLEEADYHRRKEAIEDNFYRLREFLMPEDWLCRHTPLLEWQG